LNLGVCCANGQGVPKDERAAIGWYRKAAEGGEIPAFQLLAWLLATSRNAEIRDATNAVIFAEKAVAATHRNSPIELDVLAAAYAEAGQFDKAVSAEREAIALQQAEATKSDYRTRLKLFEDGKPYRAKD
jgi:tetratricopeptide (TPR) repeat protein